MALRRASDGLASSGVTGRLWVGKNLLQSLPMHPCLFQNLDFLLLFVSYSHSNFWSIGPCRYTSFLPPNETRLFDFAFLSGIVFFTALLDPLLLSDFSLLFRPPFTVFLLSPVAILGYDVGESSTGYWKSAPGIYIVGVQAVYRNATRRPKMLDTTQRD